MKISANTRLCMIIGSPVQHSLSPAMHNAAFEALHIDNKYVYVASQISEDTILQCLKAIVTLNIAGVSCTAPLKTILIPLLEELDPIAEKIGAVNTIINNNGKLKGYNTDWVGIIEPLKKYGSLRNKSVSIIGGGGAAKAAAYGCMHEKADIRVFNRTVAKAKRLADDFGGVAISMDEISEAFNSDIIINTISDNFDQYVSSVELRSLLHANQIIFDIGYSKTSSLLNESRAQSIRSIDGFEMLLYQGMSQFQLFTGLSAPEETMRNVLLEHASKRESRND